MEQQFARSEKAIKSLWQKLNVPNEDQEVFTASVLLDVTAENLRTLNDEIQRLEDRRAAGIAVEKAIEVREGFLYLLHEMADRGIENAEDASTVVRDYAPILNSLRLASLDVVDSIMHWRACWLKSTAIYYWKGISYYIKMQQDLHFLNVSGIATALGLEVDNNPFLNSADGNTQQLFADTFAKRLPAAAKSRAAMPEAVGGKARLPAIVESSVDSPGPQEPAAFKGLVSTEALKQRVKRCERVLRDEVRLMKILELYKPSAGPQKDADAPEFEVESEADGATEADMDEPAKLHRDLKHTAALRIQTQWRGWLGRTTVRNLRKEQAAATKVQRKVRQSLAKKEAAARRKCFRCAQKIQAIVRGIIARVVVKHMKKATAVLVIQSFARANRSLQRVRSLTLQMQSQCEDSDATQMKLLGDGNRVVQNDNADDGIEEWRVEHYWMSDPRLQFPATKVQAWYHGVKARHRVTMLRQKARSAQKIQAVYRGMLGRRLFCLHVLARSRPGLDEVLMTHDLNAVNIPIMWRWALYGEEVSELYASPYRMQPPPRRNEVAEASTLLQANWQDDSTRLSRKQRQQRRWVASEMEQTPGPSTTGEVGTPAAVQPAAVEVEKVKPVQVPAAGLQHRRARKAVLVASEADPLKAMFLAQQAKHKNHSQMEARQAFGLEGKAGRTAFLKGQVFAEPLTCVGQSTNPLQAQSAQDPRVSSAVTPAQHRKNTADGLPATGMDSTATEYHEIDCLVRVSPKAQGMLISPGIAMLQQAAEAGRPEEESISQQHEGSVHQQSLAVVQDPAPEATEPDSFAGIERLLRLSSKVEGVPSAPGMAILQHTVKSDTISKPMDADIVLRPRDPVEAGASDRQSSVDSLPVSSIAADDAATVPAFGISLPVSWPQEHVFSDDDELGLDLLVKASPVKGPPEHLLLLQSALHAQLE
jgi:hypothetical protein